MIATANPNESKLISLTIVLKETNPKVWRRVLLPANATLGDLHDVIQSVMPWFDYHLHGFLVGDHHYGVPNPEFDMECDPVFEEQDVLLAEVFSEDRKRIEYMYDFGDGWDHVIKVDGFEEPEEGGVYPVCVAGENACPPEDSGSTFGYYEKLRIMQDPSHPMHAEVVGWMPPDFDSQAFDVDEANAMIRFNAGEIDEDDEE